MQGKGLQDVSLLRPMKYRKASKVKVEVSARRTAPALDLFLRRQQWLAGAERTVSAEIEEGVVV